MDIPDRTAMTWRKSSHSDNNAGACVEVAPCGDRTAIRDSKDPDGPILVVPNHQWRTFVQATSTLRWRD